MLTKCDNEPEVRTDRAGRRWEYQLLQAGSLELGRLRSELGRLTREGWEVDSAWGALEQEGAGQTADSGELHVWLRRAQTAQEQAELCALFMAAA